MTIEWTAPSEVISYHDICIGFISVFAQPQAGPACSQIVILTKTAANVTAVDRFLLDVLQQSSRFFWGSLYAL